MRWSLLESCRKRGDQWASEVENRLQGCFDLVAAEAMYHDSCLTKFSLKRDPTKKVFATGQSVINWFITIIVLQYTGRHQDESMLKWFNSLVEWLESESGAELYTHT